MQAAVSEVLQEPRIIETAGELVAKVTLPGGQLQQQADRFLTMVDAYTIDSTESLQDAANDRNDINDRHKAIEDQRKFLKEPSLEQGRRIDGFFKPVLETLIRARDTLGRKITDYTEAERRKQEQAEREAREQAEREAAAQRALAAKAEAESKAKADALRRQAEDLRAAGKAGQAAKMESKAESTEAAGQQKAAEISLQAEMTATAPVVVQEAPKAAGIGISYDYSAEVTDIALFVRHVVEKRPDLMALVEIKQAALNRQATSLREALNLPGVKLVKKPRVSDKRR